MKKSKKQKERIVLIEVLVIILLLIVASQFIYHILHWRDLVDQIRDWGLIGTVVIIAVFIVIRKWIDSL